jgi:fatty-acyl-CoA synthase
MINLAVITEAVAAIHPQAHCLVHGEQRLTYGELTDRTRRLADVLQKAGLGCHHERDQLQGWESGQDHVALYLYNGSEYMEGMLGAMKARCVPFNVNYRYVDEELIYLFANAGARAVIYHASFAPALARVRDRLPDIVLWLQVQDDSGEALLPGALDYEVALAQATSAEPVGLTSDDLYMLYTGGTTGAPKGVLWRQEDIFYGALDGLRRPADLDEIVAAAQNATQRVMPTPPMMHGGGHWSTLSCWINGGCVVLQSNSRKLDPDDVWSTIEREKVSAILIVGDAFARPLIDQLRQKSYDLSHLTVLSSGGAILSASLKDEFIELLPNLTIVDGLGSSETGTQAVQVTRKDFTQTVGSFDIMANNSILSEDLTSVVEPENQEVGWIAKQGFVPLGYLGDAEKSARTFPRIDGVRYSVPGDRAQYDASGKMVLLGRDSVTINSGGEKIYAEEVEQALKHHEEVYDAVVVGTPDERWGNQVTALILPREGVTCQEDSLNKTASQFLAAYKLPKVYLFVDEILRSPSGKADYCWAKEKALAELAKTKQG